jgi:glycosyltransferase involved in cell wall biosynthesis
MNTNLKVWVFQTGEPIHSDGGTPRPMRAMNLANALSNKGHKVVLWSSVFYHQKKQHRYKKFKKIHISDKLEIRLIPSPGYKRNVSISRLFDHFILSINLWRQLNAQSDFPDVAFVGYPPIETAFVMSNFLNKKNIPFILDVKDQWPSVLLRSMPNFLKPISRIVLSPYYFMAKKTMQSATGICGMSNGFLDWSLNFSNKQRQDFDLIAPLTSMKVQLSNNELKDALDWWSEKGVCNDGKFRIVFIGAFSRAFDFDEIFIAAKELFNKAVDCEFIFCGEGEFYQELIDKAQDYSNIKVIDWIDQQKISALSQLSSLSIAPYRNSVDFMISIPNKVVDALKLGLPILSPLKGEVSALIKDNSVGFVYNDGLSLSECIQTFIADKELQVKMSNNARELYDKDFEFNKVYNELVGHLEGMVINNA